MAIYNLANRNLCNGIFNEVSYYGLLHFVRNDEAGENANAFARHKILQISYNDAAVSFVIARNKRRRETKQSIIKQKVASAMAKIFDFN